MKKKILKLQIKELKKENEILKKKNFVLQIILKWQSEKLDLQREKRIKAKF